MKVVLQVILGVTIWSSVNRRAIYDETKGQIIGVEETGMIIVAWNLPYYQTPYQDRFAEDEYKRYFDQTEIDKGI